VILVDNRDCKDPYINLAIEEYLVRNADCEEDDYLLLYVNEPCIVLGKNQSIYKEINFKYLRNNKLQLCRRISGGGTVYQDKGNLNFSFISKFDDYKVNNYKHFNKPIVEALIKAGIPAEMDARNNILCIGKKISGNAQFTNRKNIISHGTLLFKADLSVLRESLKENDFKIETRAVSSVRSPVVNIGDISERFISVAELEQYLIDELDAAKVLHFNEDDWNEIRVLAEGKFKTPKWVYGHSPKAVIHKGEISIAVEDGIVSGINLPTAQFLIGTAYRFKEIEAMLSWDSGFSVQDFF
jgi:lipoate-protein ligase A